jgi:hypothetical protein
MAERMRDVGGMRTDCTGEVWTDARGYATISMPRAAACLHGDVAYELRPFTPGVSATVASELLDGRFTIRTDEPHVKVAWRVSGRRPDVRTNPPAGKE